LDIQNQSFVSLSLDNLVTYGPTKVYQSIETTGLSNPAVFIIWPAFPWLSSIHLPFKRIHQFLHENGEMVSQTFQRGDVSWSHGPSKGEHKFNCAEAEDIAPN
jgi:hypothetical protein